jgi:hypothetical protein
MLPMADVNFEEVQGLVKEFVVFFFLINPCPWQTFIFQINAARGSR